MIHPSFSIDLKRMNSRTNMATEKQLRYWESLKGKVSYKKNKTYNETYGENRAKEIIKKMSLSHKNLPPMKESTRLKISIANKGKILGDKNPMKKSEVRKKVSDSNKKSYLNGRICWNYIDGRSN